MIDDVVIIIPAYNPNELLTKFIGELKTNGYIHIIIIDDGSKNSSQVFETVQLQFGCKVLKHAINLGQGRAYKTGFNYYLNNAVCGGKYEHTIGAIQCDCDGQHHINDINRCSDILRANPEAFILGVRDFDDKTIPFRSRFGNNLTSFVFKAFCGMDIKDTQTGLKGIPKATLPALLETSGERFEYASSTLLEVKKLGMQVLQFPIQTIYINGNETSHFNPLLDSIRIYSLILRYLMSSLSGFVLDIIFYAILIRLFATVSPDYYILFATYISRIVLSLYVFAVNKRVVFHNKGRIIPTGIRFFVLCITQASVSGFAVKQLVTMAGGGEILFKLLVDTLLFFASFQIQDRWVFRNEFCVRNENIGL